MARSVLAATIITYALAVLQATLGARLAIAGAAPDLLLLWTLSIGLLSGPRAGLVAGFACGVLQSSLLQGMVGALSASKALSGLAAGFISTKVRREYWLAPAVSAALLTVANELVFLSLADRAAGWAHAGRVIAVRTIYHAALAPVFLAATERGHRALSGQRRGPLSHDA